MIFLKKRIDVNGRGGEIEIDIYGDTHFGSKSVDEKLLKRHIGETRETGRYWVHLGDVIDGIAPGERRFDSKNLSGWAWDALKDRRLISAEWDYFEMMFSPIADKGLFVLDGDGKHNEYGDIDDCMTKTLNRMGIPGGSPALYLALSCYRNTTSNVAIDLAFHHGWSSGRRSGGKINNIELEFLNYPRAWGFFCGHGHTKTMMPPMVGLVPEGDDVVEIIRKGAMTGGYFRTYARNTVGYPEKRGYRPVVLGRITLVLRPFHPEAEKRIEIKNI